MRVSSATPASMSAWLTEEAFERWAEVVATCAGMCRRARAGLTAPVLSPFESHAFRFALMGRRRLFGSTSWALPSNWSMVNRGCLLRKSRPAAATASRSCSVQKTRCLLFINAPCGTGCRAVDRECVSQCSARTARWYALASVRLLTIPAELSASAHRNTIAKHDARGLDIGRASGCRDFDHGASAALSELIHTMGEAE